MRETSLMAYVEATQEPVLGKRQKLILDCIRANWDRTDLEIATILNLPINCVTPRRGELEAKGLVYSAGLKNQNGRPAHKWRASRYAKPVGVVFG